LQNKVLLGALNLFSGQVSQLWPEKSGIPKFEENFKLFFKNRFKDFLAWE